MIRQGRGTCGVVRRTRRDEDDHALVRSGEQHPVRVAKMVPTILNRVNALAHPQDVELQEQRPIEALKRVLENRDVLQPRIPLRRLDRHLAIGDKGTEDRLGCRSKKSGDLLAAVRAW
jgi:hypothetical protein